MSTQIGRCIFTWLCQCHLGLEKAKRSSSFCFDNFFSSKKFNHIARLQAFSILSWAIDVNLFTSQLPPLEETPPIITIDLLQMIDSWHRKIRLTYCMLLIFDMERFRHLVWASLMSWKFSLFLFFGCICTFFQSKVSLLIKFCKIASSQILR
jgi:hypothetical protein